jgi:hypothetical protein
MWPSALAAPGGAAWHWGPNGLTRGGAANELARMSLDPNVHIQEVRAMACDIRPGRRRAGQGYASWSWLTASTP